VLAQHRLLPLLGSRLAAVVIPPEAFAAALDRALRDAETRAFVLEAQGAHVLGALERAGIAALALKGPTLARSLYGEPAMRLSDDIDVLVPAESLPGAISALEGEGYRVLGANVGLPELHYTLVRQRLPRVELHWRIHWYENAFSRDMLRRSSGAPRRPALLDDLAALLLYYARDGFVGLRLAADVATWIDLHGAELPDGALAHHMQGYPQLGRATAAAAAAVERLTGARTRRLTGGGAPDRRVAIAERLSDWTGWRDPNQVRANIALIDGLLAPDGGGGDFVRRQLVYKADAGGPGARAVVRRAAHALRYCSRFAIALWAIRRGRSLTPQPELPGA